MIYFDSDTYSIIKSVNISGNSLCIQVSIFSYSGEGPILLNFNEKIMLNALDVSFDPDEEISQPQDIAFTWYCKQASEVCTQL